MSQFTCIGCRVAFADADIQRQHYKTDWHRYNLKRKVVNLAPVTAEEFQLRVISRRQQDAEEIKDTSTYCKVCKKSFASKKAFQNHENSKRHKDLVAQLIESSDGPISANVISEPSQPQKRKDSFKSNAENPMDDDIETDSEIEELDSDEWDEEMTELHPDNPILSNDCLFCTHHSASMTKNLKHMLVEHSFFVPDIEYVEDLNNLLLYLGEKVSRLYMCLWCNFSGREFQSLEAAQKHMRDKGHCKMLHEGAALAEYERFYNYATSYPDHDDGMDVDEEILKDFDLDGGDFQLTLPSGATVGHRSLMLYYKKARDIRFMRKAQNKFYMRLGVKANKLQKHFRPQVDV
ncbi:unnamed protein product [Nesidiocoris tenuis]|uniref:C2H2-type domain-containing protein n=1 Tax=Nesidiocoris tenuis TaxID=355587 RepID=A0A6H5HAA7_9HEMI|nr:unnamed protein product [Nesidiocoris tenuis]